MQGMIMYFQKFIRERYPTMTAAAGNISRPYRILKKEFMYGGKFGNHMTDWPA